MSTNTSINISAIKENIINKFNLSPESALDIKIDKTFTNNRSSITPISILIDKKRVIHLIEKKFKSQSNEPYMYELLQEYGINIPNVYHINDSRYILIEDISYHYESLGDWDEDGKEYLRDSYTYVVESLAVFHSTFWESKTIFQKIDLPWFLKNYNNYYAHLEYLRRDLDNFKLSKIGEEYMQYFDFELAYDFMQNKYNNLLKTRFQHGRSITMIHGDLNASNVWVLKKSPNAINSFNVKFIDLEAIRIGLPTDDLVMLLTFHFAKTKEIALPLLEKYYNKLSETVYNYSFNDLLTDFRYSLMETVFFAIKLINDGIPAYEMLNGFIKTYKTFF